MKTLFSRKDWKQRWYKIIFEHDTYAGRLFDEILLIIILLSVVVVFADSMENLSMQNRLYLFSLEWIFTILFTLEYLFRIKVTPNKKKYIFSFYGIIDFLSIVPTYLSIFVAGTHFLIIIRILRLFRVFRILKLVRFTSASIYLIYALKHSREKILVFFGTVLIIVTIIGTLMYIVEGPEHGFASIPMSIYWAIVTITTVGFGDITPKTPFGQIIASLLMLTGYAIIAVPTGIITAELSRNKRHGNSKVKCGTCGGEIIDPNANFCSTCGQEID